MSESILIPALAGVASGVTVIKAGKIFNGVHDSAIEEGVVVIRNGKIVQVGPGGDVNLAGDETSNDPVRTVDYGNATVMPGLIDVHTHLVLPGDGRRAEEVMEYDDNTLTLIAARNSRRALHSGVTTLADMGARNHVTLSLRRAIQMGIAEGPRLVLCGRPLTRTGGHLWYFNEEVDGPQEIRHAIRKLVQEGVDFIKVLTTGGGTLGTDPARPAYHLEELQAAVEEAHMLGKLTAAHCSSSVGMDWALTAGFDLIFHAHFYEPDGSLAFAPDLAQRLADAPVYVNPTLAVNYSRIAALEASGAPLTEEEEAELQSRRQRYAGQVQNVGRLVEMGVKFVAGSDAGWASYAFGDLVSEMEQMEFAGMSRGDVLKAATSAAATALGVESQIGTLVPGRQADLLVVNGDPTRSLGALRKIRAVYLAGQTVIDRAG